MPCYYDVPVQRSSASDILPENLMSFHQLLVYNFSLYLWDEFYEVIKISRIIFWLYFTFIGPCFLRAWDITADSGRWQWRVLCWRPVGLLSLKEAKSHEMCCHHLLNLDQFEIEMYERKWELQKKSRNLSVQKIHIFLWSTSPIAIAHWIPLNASLLSSQTLSQVFFDHLNKNPYKYIFFINL